MKKKKLALRAAVSFAAVLAVGTLGASAKVTLNDIDGHWSKEFVEYGVEKGYINGYEDGSFMPEKTVTRAEFSKMLNSAIGISKKETISFGDVQKGEWYYDEVCKAVYAGCISGYEDNTFRPGNNITRQEAAVILSRLALRAENPKSVASFKDADDVSDWAEDAMELAYSKGFITGDDLNRLLPQGLLTRAQAAKIIYTFLQTENIHNGNYTVNTPNAICSETLFTDDVIFASTARCNSLTFDGCRVLGSVKLSGSTAATLSVKDSDLAFLELADGAAAPSISLSDDASVKYTRLQAPATLAGDGFGTIYLLGGNMLTGTVEIVDEPNKVIVSASSIISCDNLPNVEFTQKGSYTFQRGTIENMTLSAGAAGSVVTLAADVTVENLTVSGAASFMGSGTIEKADNKVSGVTYETKPKKQTGTTSGTASDDKEEKTDGFMPNSYSPSKNATNVSISADIILYYSTALYDKDGDTVTKAYLEKNVELHRASASGKEVDFDVAVNSTNRRITLVPTDNLDNGVKYYVVIPAGTFTDSEGNPSGTVSYSFTTMKSSSSSNSSNSSTSDADITYTPKNKATGVSVSDSLKIVFDSAIKDTDGDTPTSSYLSRTAIELREKSTSGEKVTINATLSSNGRTVTIKPDETLKANTKYYLIVVGSTLKCGGSKVSKDYIYFTTDDELNVTMTPDSGSTGVAPDTDIVLTFNSAILRPSGSNVTKSYLQESIELHQKSASGTELDFLATLDTDKKTVTLVPTEELAAGTKYYVVIPAGKFANESGAENEKISLNFTVATSMTPTFTPNKGSTGVSVDAPIVIKFSEPVYADKNQKPLTADYIKEKVVTFKKGTTSSGTSVSYNVEISADKTTITLVPTAPLTIGKSYYVAVKSGTLYNESKKSNASGTCTFTTANPNAPEFLPENAETDVDVDTKIEITFEDKMYTSAGKELTTSYLKSDVLALYEDSLNGTEVTFGVTLSDDKKTFTITPKSDLSGNTTYYIVVREDTLENSDGEENTEYVSYFTTEDVVSTDYTVTPKKNATGVSVETAVTFEFESPVYVYGSTYDLKTHLEKKAFTINKKSTSGDEVEFTADIDETNKIVTLTPTSALDVSTKYYVTLNANTLKYKDGTKVSKQSLYFTTSNGVPVVSSVKIVDKGASYLTAEVVSDMNGTVTVTATDGKNSESASAVLTAGEATQITVSNLASNTNYTVSAVVENSNGKSKEKTTTGKTTASFEFTVGEVTDTEAKLNVKAYCDGYADVSSTASGGVKKTHVEGLEVKQGQSKTVTLTDLSANTKYTVSVKFTDDYGASFTLTQTLTTSKARALTVEKLTVNVGDNSYRVTVAGGVGTITLNEEVSSVTFTGTASHDDAVFTYNGGDETASGDESQEIELTDDETTVEVVLKRGEESVTYTITVVKP